MSPGWLSLCLSFLLPVCPPPVLPPPTVDAVAVLHAWDARRADAWADGDDRALADLYVAGSGAGRVDRAMLRAWLRRGLRVEGMVMQLLSVEVRRVSAARLDLVVTDRLTGAIAVGAGLRVALPRDGVSTREVVLVRVEGEWQVRSVVDHARAARTTSSTVRSRNW